MVAALIFFAFVSVNPLNAWSLFGSKTLTPEEKIQQLQQQQVDHPDDPAINYNFGVALYRINRLQEAQSQFERALAHIKSHNKLEKQALFNKANTELKLTLCTLPSHWEEQEDLDQQVVSAALKNIDLAIQEYQKLLDLEPKNIKTQTNKKCAEEIKKKLEKKLKKQQQQKQDKKNDQKNDQQQEQQKKDPQEQKQQDQQKDQSSQQNQQQKEYGNEQNDQKQQHDQSPKQEQQKNEPGQSQEQQQQQQNAQQDQQESGAEQAQAGQAQQQQESSEERRMRALLENLQSEEAARQKMLVRQNAMKQQQPPQQGQKPW